MKMAQKFFWDPAAAGKAKPKLLVWLFLFVSVTYLVYTLRLLTSPHPPCDDDAVFVHRRRSAAASTDASSLSKFRPPPSQSNPNATKLDHIVFGIAASASLWTRRKDYIRLWWSPADNMRGIVWLDKPVRTLKNDAGTLPEIRISGDTSPFPYKNKQGHRSAIRISRIVSETLRLLGGTGADNVRWFVMGDDDTVFVTENLVRVLNKYDHTQYYYIGSSSESHLQNIYFSYNMAYGGGGFAISYPLAMALERMQDRCIQRYPGLYGSDDRMQACMAELGVPLTKEVGFHQFDVYGNLFGLLAAHPVAPLVSLHHLDVVEPIFPNTTQLQALRLLQAPMQLDSAGLMQQSICYNKANQWTISVSWGYAVQVIRGVLSPREMEMPSRTFLNWYKRADYRAYAFNTRPYVRNLCQKPFVFYFSKARIESNTNRTLTEYTHHREPHPLCKWNTADPDEIDMVEVRKTADPHLWDWSPRRNCCRVLSRRDKTLAIEVGVCEEGEISEA